MEYVYGALLLHSAGSEIEETKLKKVLEGAGVKADAARLKSIVSSLQGVNIEEVLKNAASATVAAAPVAPAHAAAPHEAEKKGGKKEKEEPKEEKKEGSEDDALAGLSSLFG